MAKQRSIEPVDEVADFLDASYRQRPVGLELHRLFGAVAAEPVPSVFLDLLARLDRKPAASATKNGAKASELRSPLRCPCFRLRPRFLLGQDAPEFALDPADE